MSGRPSVLCLCSRLRKTLDARYFWEDHCRLQPACPFAWESTHRRRNDALRICSLAWQSGYQELRIVQRSFRPSLMLTSLIAHDEAECRLCDAHRCHC